MLQRGLDAVGKVVEDGLVEHGAPAEVCAVSEMAVDMAGPQGQGDVVEGDDVYLIQVLARDDAPDVSIPPVSIGAIFSYWGAAQLHAGGVPLPRPVSVRRGEVLRASFSPDHPDLL